MIKLNERITSMAGSLLFGFFLMFLYVFKHTVPMTDIYLGRDRITHAIVVFLFGLFGVMLLLLLKKFKSAKVFKYIGYGLSFIFMVGIPALLFYTEYQSFRGTEWAIETFFIGLAPILFIYAAFLVFYKNRIVNLFLAFIFAAFSVYHLLLLFRILPGMGKAFSRTGKSDLLIMVVFIVFSAFFAFYSIKQYLSFRK
ncbi:MAG: hypothetical protein KAR14_01790 [Candidatus Aminicenantes bacterium]|nr:hypothetical protein [Candidatus Aminicenantes bacterium]